MSQLAQQLLERMQIAGNESVVAHLAVTPRPGGGVAGLI